MNNLVSITKMVQDVNTLYYLNVFIKNLVRAYQS